MMTVSEFEWSTQETEIVKTALETAYRRETSSLVQLIREKSEEVSQVGDLWRLNDFLSARRFDLDGKYDDREGEFLFVLARLVKEGWLGAEDLTGIAAEKLAKVSALTKIL